MGLIAARLPVVVLAYSLPITASLSTPLPRSILVIDQSSPGLYAYDEIDKEFRARLLAGPMRDTVIYREHLDLIRFRGPAYQALLSAFIREKYRGIPIGIFLAIGSAALDQAITLRTGPWAAVPIVFVAVADPAIDQSKIPANATGVTAKLSLASMLQAAKALVPGLSSVALVGDALEQQPFRWQFEHELPLSDPQLTLIDLLGQPINKVKDRIASLPPDSAILYTSINTAGDGRLVTPTLALEEIRPVARRPIVVDVETYIGRGATGGFVVRPKIVGQDAAHLVSRILNGESASEIPVSMSGSVAPIFDWRELQRWGISEAQLPPGSEIRFREPTFLQKYYWRVMLLGAAVVLQFLLIIALLQEDRRRRRAEAGFRQFQAELGHLDRVATAGELSASIAHEIRQPLTAVVAHGGAALRWLGKHPPDIGEARRTLVKIVAEGHRANDVIESTRALFRSKAANTQTTTVHLNQIIRNILVLTSNELKRHRIELSLNLAVDPVPQVQGVEIQLRQVISNLVTNAVEALRSSTGPRRLRIETMVQGDQTMTITVEDSGPGIAAGDFDKIFRPFYTTKKDGMGMGLSICRSIVEAHRGHLTVASNEKQGAAFRIVLPYSEPR
jgi:signal transduction histidine kinase